MHTPQSSESSRRPGAKSTQRHVSSGFYRILLLIQSSPDDNLISTQQPNRSILSLGVAIYPQTDTTPSPARSTPGDFAATLNHTSRALPSTNRSLPGNLRHPAMTTSRRPLLLRNSIATTPKPRLEMNLR